MALKVGELYGVLRLDGDQFDRQLDASGGKFGALGNLVKAGTKVMATSLVATAGAVTAIGTAAFKVGLDYNRMQQSSRAALTTLLGSAEAANAQMDKLDDFAKNSPFAKQVFIQAQQQLIGFGIEAGKVLPILDAIQNAVAAVGGSNDDITELTRIIAQVQSSGKITAETLNQLGARGVDAATLIGSQMGKTGQQIRDDITDGALGAEEAIQALTDGMMARFGGATANIKQQFDGAADRIKGAFRDIGSVLAAPFIDPQGGGLAVEWANALADAMRALEQKAKPAVDLIIGRFGPGLDRVTPALEAVESTINGWDLSKVNRQIDELTEYTPLISGAAAALFALGANGIGLGRLGISLNPVVTGLAALVATSPDLRRAFGELIEAGGDLAATWAQALGPAATTLVQASVPLIETVADLVSWIAQLPQPLVTAAAAMVAFHGPLSLLNGPLRDVGEAFVRFGQQAQVQATLGNTNIAIGGLATASMNATGLVRGLGDVMKTAFLANPIGIALTIITTAVAAFATAQAEAKRNVDELADSLDLQTGAITENTRALAFNRLEEEGTIDRAKDLGIALSDLVDAALDPTSEGFERLSEMGRQANEELARAQAEGPQNAAGINAVATENEGLYSVLRDVRVVQEDLTEAQERHRDEVEAGIHTTEGATEATNAHTDALKAEYDAQQKAAEANISQREAEIRATEAKQALTAAITEGAQVVRDNTGAVDANAEATIAADKVLLTAASDFNLHTESMRRNNASAAELNGVISAQRTQFIESATQMGYTRGEAQKLADAYGLIPEQVNTSISLSGHSQVQQYLATMQAQIRELTGNHTIRVARGPGGSGGTTFDADGGIHVNGVKQFADGGIDSRGNYVARVPQIVAGGRNILWGEQATGWESYISGKPSARQRNYAVMDETARRLGGIFVRPLEDGGRVGGGSPAPTTGRAPVLEGLRIRGHLDLETGFLDGRVVSALDQESWWVK